MAPIEAGDNVFTPDSSSLGGPGTDLGAKDQDNHYVSLRMSFNSDNEIEPEREGRIAYLSRLGECQRISSRDGSGAFRSLRASLTRIYGNLEEERKEMRSREGRKQ